MSSNAHPFYRELLSSIPKQPTKTRSLGDIFVIAQRSRLAAMLAGALLVGAAVGYYFHKPEPEVVIDFRQGDVDQGKFQEQWMTEGRFHWFYQCAWPYHVVTVVDNSDPESGDTSGRITTCE
jgi:hypothetical protein